MPSLKKNLTAIGVVKSFNREDFEEERFAVANDSLRDTALSAVNIIAFFMPIINIVIWIAFGLVNKSFLERSVLDHSFHL